MKSSGRTVCTLRLGATVIALTLPLAATHAATRVESCPVQDIDVPCYEASQDGGKTLEEAIHCVRNQGNVDSILQAETRVSGGREVHHIKVLMKDGAIRTYKIPGTRGGPFTPLSGAELSGHSTIDERPLVAVSGLSIHRFLE